MRTINKKVDVLNGMKGTLNIRLGNLLTQGTISRADGNSIELIISKELSWGQTRQVPNKNSILFCSYKLRTVVIP